MDKPAIPLVSVLMTVYNREKYIEEAIESVLASTYKNFELIIVDDRSTDNSLEIAQQFEKNDWRIKVFQNEHNLGDYPNRNQAASYATGKYLKYVDADDMIYPYGLEQLVYYMEKFPDAGYGLCSLDQDKDSIYPFQLSSKEAYQWNYFKSSIFHKAPLSSIIRKDAFSDVGGFSKVRHYGDFEFWHKISLKYPVVLMPHGMVWYRTSEGQEASIRKKNTMNQVKTLNVSRHYVAKFNFYKNSKQQEVLNYKHLKSYQRYLMQQIKRFNFKDIFMSYKVFHAKEF